MFQVGDTCYFTEGAALSVIASKEAGKVVSAGPVVYAVDAAPSGTTSIAYTLSPTDGTTPLTFTQTVALQPCGQLDHTDGLAIGWGVAAAWIAAAALMSLRKAAKEAT